MLTFYQQYCRMHSLIQSWLNPSEPGCVTPIGDSIEGAGPGLWPPVLPGAGVVPIFSARKPQIRHDEGMRLSCVIINHY